MIEIDGAEKSGSGAPVRCAVARLREFCVRTARIESNLRLAQKIPGAGAELDDRLISIDGIGFLGK
ncbi:MAG: hypothetical protein LLG06_10160 [Desulfobacteraceae bacterium]|nr:hypothetical protein [Desulfobacteraceae bacterium]